MREVFTNTNSKVGSVYKCLSINPSMYLPECIHMYVYIYKYCSLCTYLISSAIYGYGFCKAAQKAFSLLVNNAFRVAAINYVGAFVLFLSKATVVISSVFIGIEIMKVRGI